MTDVKLIRFRTDNFFINGLSFVQIRLSANDSVQNHIAFLVIISLGIDGGTGTAGGTDETIAAIVNL